MKKHTAFFLLVLFTFAFLFSISAGAASISRLPVDPSMPVQASNGSISPYQPQTYTLQKNVALNTNLSIEEGEVLTIPKGKRLTLKKGKTITVKGGIYIEEGGSLVIENGTLALKERGTVLSYGKLNLKKDGAIKLDRKTTLIVGESGSLTEKGRVSNEDEAATLICLGKYTGEMKRKTKILTAISLFTENYTDVLKESKFYSSADAKALFPTLSASKNQEMLVGTAYNTQLFFYCDNDQWFSYIIQGDFESKAAILGNMIVRRA